MQLRNDCTHLKARLLVKVHGCIFVARAELGLVRSWEQSLFVSGMWDWLLLQVGG